MRTSYVQIDGQLHKKTGSNTVVINGQIYYNFGGTWAPEPPRQSGPAVMPDIQPYQSTIDGSLISSRSRHREHLLAHNCIEVGNERPKPKQETWTALNGLRQELIARINN